MDVPRPHHACLRRRRRRVAAALGVVILGATTFVLARLEPAAPTVERDRVLIDTVRQGELVRQVRGLGTLVPEEIRWIAARTPGRVERIVLRPGSAVDAGTILLELANPEVEQAAVNADLQLRAAEAELLSLRVTLQSAVLQAESNAAALRAEFEQSRLTVQVNEELHRKGLLSRLDLELARVRAEQAATRHAIEQKRYQFAQDTIEPQLAVKLAEVERARTVARLRRDERDALQVRSPMPGVLQVLPVEVGAQVQPGANLARVADPARLKAEIRIAETQARDIQPGQRAAIDTRHGVVDGQVVRIDPSVQNGTVTVDVRLDGAPPRGARPDLSVDGTIELERLDGVLQVARPAFGAEHGSVGLFRLEPGGATARRAPVKLGRSSVQAVEVVEGLRAGDRVILSDMSAWESHERIRLH